MAGIRVFRGKKNRATKITKITKKNSGHAGIRLFVKHSWMGMKSSMIKPGIILILIILCAGCAAQPAPAIPTLTVQEATMTLTPEPAPLDWWRPALGLSWQWQLTGKIDMDYPADVYDIDLDVPKEMVDALHARGRRVICYISVGSWEDWRPDADAFPPELLGKDYEGWKGEKWLDIRRLDLLGPIMQARLDRCASSGFDAVEPDNIEIHTNDTGFPLSYQDQLKYARWLADEAHQRGLAIGLKNAPDQVKDLVDLYDFAITEDAFFYGWTDEMLPFIRAGKPVFAAEYTDLGGDFEAYCRRSQEFGFSLILKRRNLGRFIQICK